MIKLVKIKDNCYTTVIKNDNEKTVEPIAWITMGGKHVPIDKEGNLGGNPIGEKKYNPKSPNWSMRKSATTMLHSISKKSKDEISSHLSKYENGTKIRLTNPDRHKAMTVEKVADNKWKVFDDRGTDKQLTDNDVADNIKWQVDRGNMPFITKLPNDDLPNRTNSQNNALDESKISSDFSSCFQANSYVGDSGKIATVLNNLPVNVKFDIYDSKSNVAFSLEKLNDNNMSSASWKIKYKRPNGDVVEHNWNVSKVCRKLSLSCDNKSSIKITDNGTVISKVEKNKQRLAEVEAKNPKSIAGADRESPMTLSQADSGKINPNYNDKKYDDFSVNCQSCVACFEARLRGYDVEALPNVGGRNGDGSAYSRDALNGNCYSAWLDKDGKVCKPIKSNVKDVHTASQVIDFMNKCFDRDDNGEYLKGSRYTFAFTNKGCRVSAHIISLDVNDEGYLRLYDPQCNEFHIGKEVREYIKDYVRLTDTIEILRVDDKEMNHKVYNKIMKKKGN